VGRRQLELDVLGTQYLPGGGYLGKTLLFEAGESGRPKVGGLRRCFVDVLFCP
jgi:hypothetical protein